MVSKHTVIGWRASYLRFEMTCCHTLSLVLLIYQAKANYLFIPFAAGSMRHVQTTLLHWRDIFLETLVHVGLKGGRTVSCLACRNASRRAHNSGGIGPQ